MDTGFLYKNNVYNTKPILQLLAKDTAHLRICPRLTPENVLVKKTARKKVKHAARLFSNNVSMALTEYAGAEAEPAAWLLKIVNDWFDVLNSNILRKDSRQGTLAFGLQMEV